MAEGDRNRERGAYVLAILDGCLELVVSLAAFILVEVRYGRSGLGFFSFLFSVYILGSYLAEFGVPNYVERAVALLGAGNSAKERIERDGARAILLLGIAGGGVLFALFFWPFRLTHMKVERITVLLIALAIPIRNLNHLQIASLHGRHRHAEAARLRLQKRLFYIGTVGSIVLVKVPLTSLTLSFVLPEAAIFLLSTARSGIPYLRKCFKGLEGFWSTLREGQRTLFTDNALDVILYVDFLVLGFFVSANEEGVYAKASILARLFLVVPLSLRSIFRERYCSLVAQGRGPELSELLRRLTERFFFWHAVVMLYVILNYHQVIRSFFPDKPQFEDSLLVFERIVVGLLFYSSVVALEPVYEATQRIGGLRKLVVSVFVLNLGLNLYLVPYAGAPGAATASAISMLGFFVLFGTGLDGTWRPEWKRYLSAGATVYICYTAFRYVNPGFWITLIGVPLLMMTLLRVSGFFSETLGSEQERAIQPGRH